MVSEGLQLSSPLSSTGSTGTLQYGLDSSRLLKSQYDTSLVIIASTRLINSEKLGRVAGFSLQHSVISSYLLKEEGNRTETFEKLDSLILVDVKNVLNLDPLEYKNPLRINRSKIMTFFVLLCQLKLNYFVSLILTCIYEVNLKIIERFVFIFSSV